MFYLMKESVVEFIVKLRVAHWVRKHGCSFRNVVSYHKNGYVRPLVPQFHQGRVKFDEEAYQKLCKILHRKVTVDTWEIDIPDSETKTKIHPVTTPCVAIPAWLVTGEVRDFGRKHHGQIYIPLYKDVI
ncbi:hypothetical protein WELLINGTON_121 [Erwinia phage Wellington]|uniref:Uncharacterized protein n=1 Tax=Erwinia phage Wellington TaxID=2267653 RepID=A0A345BLD0_9CAUD|nr:hypothetical protein HOT70_gp180 [Erwinia phage Wellington]AXF51251.1 hypothetical protein WELLINGTON_121 [Erwinia phage Wellington]